MVSFEWGPDKARTNAQKHGVEFADAVAALEDEDAVTMPDEEAEDEVRFVSVGRDAFSRILVVSRSRLHLAW